MTKVDVRLQRARRRLGGARVLAIKLRVEPFPTCRMRGLCGECQSRCGATPFEPRPVGTTLECVSPWLATPTLRGQSGRREPRPVHADPCAHRSSSALLGLLSLALTQGNPAGLPSPHLRRVRSVLRPLAPVHVPRARPPRLVPRPNQLPRLVPGPTQLPGWCQGSKANPRRPPLLTQIRNACA